MTTGNLFTRDDTFLGVCQGLGDDLAFNPLWLRLAFGLMLFWNPIAMAAAYVGLGALVLLSRLVFPAPRAPAAPAVEVAPARREIVEQAELPLAA
jgi:phage shock protein PspC (stress-responsive transcriptional regulator)